MPGLKRKLTGEERRERSRVYLLDTAALGTLFAIAVALSFVTWALFHSFTAHKLMLQVRWRHRGEAAMAAGRPLVAVEELRSALAYAPDDRGLQIELAKALAAAGRTQEAQVYFTTLLESEPGSGEINLQMARLSARTGDPNAAVDHYQASIDGTWNGDAFTRRRAIRLELARYLIARGRDAEARNLLLITSGNGPENYPLQLEVGGLLEQANGGADALDVYRKAAGHRATRLDALLGEARAARGLGRYAQTRSLLEQAVAEPGFARQEPQVRDGAREELREANAVLALYPSVTLPNAERARRIGRIAQMAEQRLLGCPLGAETQKPEPPSAQAGAPLVAIPAPDTRTTALAALSALAAHLQQLNPLAPRQQQDQPVVAQPALPADPLGNLAARWTVLPAGAALAQALQRDPGFAENVLQLAYETERATASSCGAPAGEAELLMRIAQAPAQVEAQG